MEHGWAFCDAWLAISVLSVQATWSGDVLAVTDALENAGVVAWPVNVYFVHGSEHGCVFLLVCYDYRVARGIAELCMELHVVL